MNNKLQKILISLSACILISVLIPVMAQDVQEKSPIEALRALYDSNKDFRSTMDNAFAYMEDPDPNSADLWPNPVATNPWKG